jgi:TonB family protein
MDLGVRPLRVVLVWRGEPLEERVFAKPEVITVGASKQDTFTVPPSRVGESFPLFRGSADSNGFVLTLTPGMTGKLSIGGEPWAVSEFIAAGRGVPAGPYREQPLATSDWGIVALDETGDVAFFFQFIAKGLRIGPKQTWMDRFFGQALAMSALVLGALLIIAFLTWEPTDALDIDPPPSTAIAKLIFDKPPEEKPEEKKKSSGGDDPRKRREEDSSKRAAGKEGKIGNPDAKAQDTKIPKGPKDQIVQKVSNMGLLGTLKQNKSGALKMLLSDTPDANVTTAMAGLKSTTELVVGKGSGGMSTRGEGPGGGGTGKGQLYGVGNLAVGGGGHGKPGGGGGTGGGLGGHQGKELKVAVQTGTPDSSGGLSKEQILKVVMSHAAAIQFCYEKELQRFPHLSGKVMLYWVVNLDGRVDSVKVDSSTLGNPSAESCMARQVKNWQFPRPNGVTAKVTFPFFFKGQ